MHGELVGDVSISWYVYSHPYVRASSFFCEYKSQQCRQDYIDYSTTSTSFGWLFLLLVSAQDQFVFGSFFISLVVSGLINQAQQESKIVILFTLSCLYYTCEHIIRRHWSIRNLTNRIGPRISTPSNYTIPMTPDVWRRVRRPMPISVRRPFPCSRGWFLPSCRPLISFMIRSRS